MWQILALDFVKQIELKKVLQFLLVVAVLIGIYKLYKYLTKPKPTNANYDPNGGQIPVGWTPTAITDGLFTAFDSAITVSGEEKADAVQRLFDLSNNQLIAVYNDWANRYQGKSRGFLNGNYPSLTETIRGESFGWNDTSKAQILLILERLQLN